MTRETKVGLIVGLAFIMVFAVILSHKGTQPRATDTSEFGPLVDATSANPDKASGTVDPRRKTGGSTNARGDGRITSAINPVGSGVAKPQPAVDKPAGRANAVNGTNTALPPTPSPLSDPAAAKPRIALPEMPSATAGQATREPERLSPHLETWLESGPKGAAEGDRSRATAQRTAPPIPTPPAPPAPEARPPAVERHEPESPKPAPAATDPGAEPKPRVKQEYIVKRKDTVTSIAQAVYGKGGTKEINAILAANKKQVPSPTKLREGLTLVIPNLPADQFVDADFPPKSRRDSGTPAESAPPKGKEPATIAPDVPDMKATHDAAAPLKSSKDLKPPSEAKIAKEGKTSKGPQETKESGTAPEKPESWYTVRENESFAAIARKRLGSADRWREIAELNKGKYPDPMKVPAGAKIKLPPKSGGKTSDIGGLSKL